MDKETLFSYCIGGLALISTIASAIIFSRAYLPGTQIKILDGLLQETTKIYIEAKADKSLPEGVFRIRVEQKLVNFRKVVGDLQDQAYSATTVIDEYVALFQGLSKEIMQCSLAVKKLRSYLTTASRKQKHRRGERLRRIIRYERVLALVEDNMSRTGTPNSIQDNHILLSEEGDQPLSFNQIDANATSVIQGDPSDSSFNQERLRSPTHPIAGESSNGESAISLLSEKVTITTAEPDILSRSSTLVNQPDDLNTLRSWSSLASKARWLLSLAKHTDNDDESTRPPFITGWWRGWMAPCQPESLVCCPDIGHLPV